MRRQIQLVLILYFLLLQSIPSLAQGNWHNPAGDSSDKAKSFMLYQKALHDFEIGNYVESITLLQQAIQIDQSNKDLYHLCALAMSESGDNYNAMLTFREALTCDYNFIICRNNFGIFLHKIGKLDEAKQAFRECIKIDEKFPDAHYHLGQILQEQGDLDSAIEEYETATRLKPSYFEAQRDLGLAIYEKASAGVNEITESEDKLKTACKLAPENPMIHYYLGNIYCAAGKLDDAETEYRTALNCDPKLAAAHYELGRLRYYRGDLDRCLMEMQAALKVNPVYTDSKKYAKVDIFTTKEFIAKCNELKNRLLNAVEAWKEVAAMQTNNKATLKHINDLEKELRADAHKKQKYKYDQGEVQAMLMNGIDQAESGELEQAKSTFNQVLSLNPESFEATQNLGFLTEAGGDLNEALAQYKKGMALMPKFDGIYYNMAYLLEKLGLPADAGLMYQRFHEIAGKYPYDSKHIVALQQEDARQRARAQEIRQRGY